MEYLTIELNNPIGFYYAGERIKGRVNIRVTERFKINCIRFSAIGYTKVQWYEYQKNSAKKTKFKHNAVTENLNFNLIFTEKIRENQELYIESGDYSYPFDVSLPTNLPSSFEYNFARTRYFLISTIDVPWGYDYRFKRFITIMNRVNLNLFNQAKIPVGVSLKKVYGCCFFKSKPINCDFSLIQGGFVPGEDIILEATIDNQSSKDINKFQISLVQKLNLKADQISKIVKRFMVTLVYPKKIKRETKKEFNNLILKVPPVNPNSFSSSSIVNISYYIKIIFDIEGPSIDTDLIIPIVIGTIPVGNELAVGNQITYMPSKNVSEFIGDKEISTNSNENEFEILFPNYSFE